MSDLVILIAFLVPLVFAVPLRLQHCSSFKACEELDRTFRTNEIIVFDKDEDNDDLENAKDEEIRTPICGLRPAFSVAKNERIVGGQEAKQGQFPWQAQLLITNPERNNRLEFQCGGTLINENAVLTAAHCFKRFEPSLYTIILGKHISEVKRTCNEQRFSVTKIVIHPNHNTRLLYNDIALVWIRSKYNQAVYFTDYIQPACLPNPSDRDIYAEGNVASVSGWGLMEENGSSGAEFLQHVSVPIVNPDKCLKGYENLVSLNVETQFCAGNSNGQDACAGDSGGPFVMKINDRFTVIGIVSFGFGCGRPDFPGVYTKVQTFIDWILNELKQEGSASSVRMIPFRDAGGLANPTESIVTPPSTFSTVTTTSTTKTTTTPKAITTTTIATTITTTTTIATTITTTTTASTTTTAPSRLTVEDISEQFSSGKTHKIFGPICFGSFQFLICPQGFVLNIMDAFFGRLDARACPSMRKGHMSIPCYLNPALNYMDKSKCQGERGCWIHQGLFRADPCPGIDKYIMIKYECVSEPVM